MRRSRAGFTFVELLIAATMMAILFLGLGGQLRGGITVWQRTTSTAEALQRERVALERLERDLAHALVYDARDDAYGPPPKLPSAFAADEFQWFAAQPARPGRLGSVRFVSYRCGELQGTSGLWRMSRSIGSIRAESEPPEAELLLPDCETLAVRYAFLPQDTANATAPLEWYPVWSSRERLPRLVEVSLARKAGGSITRVLSVPSGVLEPYEPAGTP